MSDQPYDVAITARAARDLHRLPEKILFGPLADHPYRLGKPLREELDGLHSARRGDYRVIYAINDAHHRMEIVHIDRRGEVYR